MPFDWSDIDSFGQAVFAVPVLPDRVLSGRQGVSRLYELQSDTGSGYVEVFSFSDGLAMVIFNCQWNHGRTFEVRDDERVRFSFTLDLNISMDVGTAVIDAHTPAWQLMNNARGVVTQETVKAGSKTVWVTVAFEPSYLDRFLSDPAEVREKPGLQNLRKYPEESIVQSYPLDHQLNLITSNIILLNADEQVYLALGHAKATELISHALDRLLTRPETENPDQPLLRSKDREAIRLARDLLVNNLEAPPSIRELCTAVGINRNKLHYGFREEFGLPPSQYLEERRLEAAYEALRDSDKLIYQIASDVGYKSQSSFATAFKRRYNVTPSAFRSSLPAARPTSKK